MISPSSPAEHAKAHARAEGFHIVRILHENHYKQTATALIEMCNGEQAILKCITPTALSAIQEHFKTERMFYTEGGFRLAPKVLKAEEHFFVREYVAGTSVRQWILSGAHTQAELLGVVSTLVTELAEKRVHSPQVDLIHAASKVCASRIRNLLTSGPANTERSAASQGAAVRAARLAMPVVRLGLQAMYGRWHKRGVAYSSPFGHNDLHCDNVLMAPSGPIVIDYERVTQPGFWHVDVLYFVATVYASLTDVEQRKKLMQHAVASLVELEPRMGPELGGVAKLLAGVSLTNARFRGTSGLTSQNLRSFLQLLEL